MARKTEAVSAWATQTAASFVGELDRVTALVSVGMSEAELIKAMGKPTSRSVDGDTLFYRFTFAPPPFWDEGEPFPAVELGLSVSKKKKYEGRIQLGWSAADVNDSFPEAEFQGVVTALAALFTPRHGAGAKGKGKLKQLIFSPGGQQLSVSGGISYQTAQLSITLQPA